MATQSTPPQKLFADLEIRYVAPRASKSIVAQAGSVKPTTETLQTMNAFLDELLILWARSIIESNHLKKQIVLDQVKASLTNLLSQGPLYTELVSKAMESVQQQQGTPLTPTTPDPSGAQFDMIVEATASPESLAQVLRGRCLHYSTLGGDSKTFCATRETTVVDLPAAVFVTAAIEFVGSHFLYEAAQVAVQQNRNLVRMLDVYSVLSNHPLTSRTFSRMSVCTKLKRLLRVPSPEPISSASIKALVAPPVHLKVDDSTVSGASKSSSTGQTWPSNIANSTSLPPSPPTTRRRPAPPALATSRPAPIHGLSANSGNLVPIPDKLSPRSNTSFETAHSKLSSEGNEVWRAMTNGNTASAPTSPKGDQIMDFEDLLQSKDTIKLSLTPNRLNTIEDTKAKSRHRPREPQNDTTSLLTGRRASIHRKKVNNDPSAGSLSNSDALPTSSALDDISDDSDDEDFSGAPRRGNRGETLYQFLRNTGPEDLLPKNAGGGPKRTIRKQISLTTKLSSVREEAKSNTLPSSQSLVGPSPSGPYSSNTPPTPSRNRLVARAAKSTGELRDTQESSDIATDDSDDELLNSSRQRRRRQRQESLGDFLRDTEPPVMPPSSPVSLAPSTSSRRSGRSVMRLFSRFGGNNTPTVPSVHDDMDIGRRGTTHGSSTTNHSGSSFADPPFIRAPPSGNEKRHVAIKIPYTPSLPTPAPPVNDTTSSAPLNDSRQSVGERPRVETSPDTSIRSRATAATAVATAASATLPPPPLPKTVNEMGTQATEPIKVMHDKGVYAPRPTTAEVWVQTDVIEEEEEEEKTDAQVVSPADIPLPESDDDDLLETEAERDMARFCRIQREMRFRVPTTVMELIREVLPGMIRAGEETDCMEFLEELLFSGSTISAGNVQTQTCLSGALCKFEMSSSMPTSNSTDKPAFTTALPVDSTNVLHGRRRSIS